jgi:hypothetical protein
VSVWAGSSFNIFVANNLGTILHYDGKDWSVLPRYSNRARCLWGDSNGDLLVGGSGVLRYQR